MNEFFQMLFQTFHSSPDWIKFVWVTSPTVLFICLIWMCFTYAIQRHKLINERLKIETERQTILDEQAQFNKTMDLYTRVEETRDKLPSHIDRQENYLLGHDIKNFESWLIEKRQKQAEAETTNTEPTPNAPEPVTPPPPFHYTDDGGNGDGSSGDDKKDNDHHNNACHELPDAAWLKPIASRDNEHHKPEQKS